MYFYKKQGKQHLDFRGDFILTHNDTLVKTRVKSAAPRHAHNAIYILEVGKHRFKASLAALAFIWGQNTALVPETIEEDNTVNLTRDHLSKPFEVVK